MGAEAGVGTLPATGVAHHAHDRSTDYRVDIQLMRAYAVALVVIFHAKMPGFAGGYLGVDIFFVVSGFLITGNVARAIIARKFSLRNFYARRARRLLPAAYTLFFFTAVFSVYFLDAAEYRSLESQLWGALGYMSNVVLWRQTGYFDSASEFKPLLHIWSLSLEEQYYLVLPAVMLIVPRRRWIRVLGGIAAASLVFCAILYSSKPSASFYLLPTRAWELGIGSLAALLMQMQPARVGAIAALLHRPALLLMVLVPLFPLDLHRHPGVDALLVCFATAILLAAKKSPREGMAVRIGETLGNASYSIYLVHWPVFAWINNAHLGTPGTGAAATGLGASLAGGFALYLLVERPLRAVGWLGGKRGLAILLASSAVLCITPSLASRWAYGASALEMQEAMRPVIGFDDACDATGAFAADARCQSGARPKILVWGDSFAMHLVPGLAASTGEAILQATRTNCSPMLGLAPVGPAKNHTRKWAEECIGFNESVLSYLRSDNDIETVILASPFEQNMPVDEARDRNRVTLVMDQRLFESHPLDRERARASLVATVQAIRQTGKKVVIIGAPPRSPINVARCNARAISKVITFDGADCGIERDQSEMLLAASNRLLAEVAFSENVSIIRLEEALCDEDQCFTKAENRSLYRDDAHLSVFGSHFVGNKLGLARRAQAEAS